MLTRPEDLTNKMINQVGEDYYRLNPKGKFLTWLSHDNHNLADKLIKYRTKFTHMESSPVEKWGFLLRIYSDIKDPNGKLAKLIDELFMQAFDMTHVPKFKMFQSIRLELSTAMVVYDLRNRVDAHFPAPAPLVKLGMGRG